MQGPLVSVYLAHLQIMQKFHEEEIAEHEKEEEEEEEQQGEAEAARRAAEASAARREAEAAAPTTAATAAPRTPERPAGASCTGVEAESHAGVAWLQAQVAELQAELAKARGSGTLPQGGGRGRDGWRRRPRCESGGASFSDLARPDLARADHRRRAAGGGFAVELRPVSEVGRNPCSNCCSCSCKGRCCWGCCKARVYVFGRDHLHQRSLELHPQTTEILIPLGSKAARWRSVLILPLVEEVDASAPGIPPTGRLP